MFLLWIISNACVIINFLNHRTCQRKTNVTYQIHEQYRSALPLNIGFVGSLTQSHSYTMNVGLCLCIVRTRDKGYINKSYVFTSRNLQDSLSFNQSYKKKMYIRIGSLFSLFTETNTFLLGYINNI